MKVQAVKSDEGGCRARAFQSEDVLFKVDRTDALFAFCGLGRDWNPHLAWTPHGIGESAHGRM